MRSALPGTGGCSFADPATLGSDLFLTLRGLISATPSSATFKLFDAAGRMFGLRKAAADILAPVLTGEEVVGGEACLGGGDGYPEFFCDMGLLLIYSGGVRYASFPGDCPPVVETGDEVRSPPLI